MLASFYYGYVLTQLVTGCVSPWWGRLSGRCALLAGSLVTCVVTLVTPVVTSHGHVIGIAAARAVAGIGQVRVRPPTSRLTEITWMMLLDLVSQLVA